MYVTTNLRENTTKRVYIPPPTSTYARVPLSIPTSLEKVGQCQPTSQSERGGCERGGASLLRSRKKYKIAGCRINIHNVAERHLSEPSIWLTKETKLPIRWSSGRRVEATRSVDIYVWASYWCAVLSRLEHLGEGSCQVQKRKLTSIVSHFSYFSLANNHFYDLSVKPNTAYFIF